MLVVRSSWHRQDSGRTRPREGGGLQDDRDFAFGRYGHGTPTSHLTPPVRCVLILVSQYVGEAEKLVHAVFTLARKLSPCVIFIDEIDALLGQRVSKDPSGGGAQVHRGTITEFMQQMDGITSKSDNVIVIGATNRPFDLDDAVLRRLPRRMLVDLPGEKEREGMSGSGVMR